MSCLCDFHVIRLLDALERVSGSIPIPVNKSSTLITQKSFAVAVQRVDSENFSGLNFSAILGNFTDQNVDNRGLLFNKMSNETPTGMLSLPRDLLEKAINGTRLSLSVFVTNSLFLRRMSNQMEVGSIIISAGVVGTRRVENLTSPVVIVFQTNPVRHKDSG